MDMYAGDETNGDDVTSGPFIPVYEYYICPNCGHPYTDETSDDGYCPKCGADEDGNIEVPSPFDEPRESLFEEQYENNYFAHDDDFEPTYIDGDY
jgi:rubredoxin